VIFSDITEKECVEERYIHSKSKIRFVQHCTAVSATDELLLAIVA